MVVEPVERWFQKGEGDGAEAARGASDASMPA
jgi:hypothetical protein